LITGKAGKTSKFKILVFYKIPSAVFVGWTVLHHPREFQKIRKNHWIWIDEKQVATLKSHRTKILKWTGRYYHWKLKSENRIDWQLQKAEILQF
jgi:hypothetical protein